MSRDNIGRRDLSQAMGSQAPRRPKSTQTPHHSSRTAGNADPLVRKDQKGFMLMRDRMGTTGKKREHTSQETIDGLAIFTSEFYLLVSVQGIGEFHYPNGSAS